VDKEVINKRDSPIKNFSLKFNNGRLFIRGAMLMPLEEIEEIKTLAQAFGKQTTPESIEGGFKLGFSLEDFFSPTGKPVVEYCS
jgi:hypothetical protein